MTVGESAGDLWRSSEEQGALLVDEDSRPSG